MRYSRKKTKFTRARRSNYEHRTLQTPGASLRASLDSNTNSNQKLISSDSRTTKNVTGLDMQSIQFHITLTEHGRIIDSSGSSV